MLSDSEDDSDDESIKQPAIDYDVEKLILLKQTTPEDLASINPVLRALIDGVCEGSSPLSAFLGAPHLLQLIWTIVSESWKELVKEGADPYDTDSVEEGTSGAFSELHGRITFPKPQDIYINMMPFIMERKFKKCKLPKNLKPDWKDLIDGEYYMGYGGSCKLIKEEEVGKIGYLTIHESYVKKNGTQRRPGLHTDCPGKLMIAEDEGGDNICLGRVAEDREEEVIHNIESRIGGGFSKVKIVNWTHPWGMGLTCYQSDLIGGIYMASNVNNSCEVWNCRLLSYNDGKEIIGNLGDIEYLREFLPEGERMCENRMYWITDRTPHESLPLKKGAYRQYFRLVTSQVSVWFEEHSTKNPLGVVPDPAITKVVKGSKFENNLALLDLKADAKPPGKEDKMKRYAF